MEPSSNEGLPHAAPPPAVKPARPRVRPPWGGGGVDTTPPADVKTAGGGVARATRSLDDRRSPGGRSPPVKAGLAYPAVPMGKRSRLLECDPEPGGQRMKACLLLPLRRPSSRPGRECGRRGGEEAWTPRLPPMSRPPKAASRERREVLTIGVRRGGAAPQLKRSHSARQSLSAGRPRPPSKATRDKACRPAIGRRQVELLFEEGDRSDARLRLSVGAPPPPGTRSSRVKALLSERPPSAPLTTAEGMVPMPSIPPNGRTRGRAGLMAGGDTREAWGL
jgi:hypothetical protein